MKAVKIKTEVSKELNGAAQKMNEFESESILDAKIESLKSDIKSIKLNSTSKRLVYEEKAAVVSEIVC